MHQKIDRDEIHRLLWERRDRLNRVRVHQRELAAELGYTHYTMSRIFKELQESGAIKKISAAQGNIALYAIREPKE